MNSSGGYISTAEIVFTSLSGISCILCLLAAILVLALKLYSKIVYRLALYQVLSSLAFAMVETLGIIFVNYRQNPEVYGGLCLAFGWLNLYFRWVKLFFTLWVTFHLFCFGALQKNLTKLEPMYIVTSILLPVLIACVPLITHSYGLVSVGACYIHLDNDTQYIAVIEGFALWDGPAMVLLSIAAVAMIIMMIKLTHRVCWRLRYETLTTGDQYWKALKQLLPLAAFPILFFLLIIPELILHIYQIRTSTPDQGLAAVASACISLWGVSSGVTLLLHISLALLCDRQCRRKRVGDIAQYRSNNLITFNGGGISTSLKRNSATWFSLPSDGFPDSN